MLRDVGVGPGGLGARRGAGGVGDGHLAEQREGAGRQPVGADLVRPVAEFVEVRPEVDGAGPARGGRLPRDRPGQRPVDLDGGEVPLEVAEVPAQPGGKVLGGDQPAVQRGGGGVREDGPAGPVAAAVGGAHPERPPVPHHHLADGLAAVHLPAPRLQPAHQRVGQRGRPAHRHRPAVAPSEHRHQPAEHAAAGGLRQQVGVQGAAGQQHPGGVPLELLLRQPPHRQGQEAGQLHQAGHPQPGRDRRARPQRRERGEQRVDQVRLQPVPPVGQPLPGPGVVRTEHPLQPGRLRFAVVPVAVAVQQPAAPVGQRVGQHHRGVAPAQPELRQAQRADRRGGGGQRVEGAEQVRDVARVHPPVTADRATGPRLFLQHDHVPARVREQIGRDQPVGACPDHDRIRHVGLLGSSSRPRLPGCRRRTRSRAGGRTPGALAPPPSTTGPYSPAGATLRTPQPAPAQRAADPPRSDRSPRPRPQHHRAVLPRQGRPQDAAASPRAASSRPAPIRPESSSSAPSTTIARISSPVSPKQPSRSSSAVRSSA